MLKVDGRLTSRDKEKAERHLMPFLTYFLPLIIGLGLPDPMSWKIMTGGAATFHLWSPKLKVTSYAS